MMQEYYTYDMTKLDKEISNLVNTQLGKITSDKEKKLAKFDTEFSKISNLAE